MKIKLKPYPQPKKGVPGSTSQFSIGTIEKKENGKIVKKEILETAEPDCPVCDFSYDPTTGKAQFIQLTDGNGNLLFRKSKSIAPYIPSTELIELVRLAQILQRPVLINGEPGSRKTQLARSVASEWYGAV